MQFKYKINLEVEISFQAALLGCDTTTGYRNKANAIAKEALAKLIDEYSSSHSCISQEIQQTSFEGSVNGEIRLQSARKNNR